jgi:GT2 family glycosyltransferase
MSSTVPAKAPERLRNRRVQADAKTPIRSRRGEPACHSYVIGDGDVRFSPSPSSPADPDELEFAPVHPVLPLYLVHWKAPEWCRTSIESIQASTEVSVKITVLNNGGELHLPSFVRVVELRGNLGFAAAVNVALDEFLASNGADYVFIGSHDICLAPDALRLLIDTLERRPDVGVLAPRVANAAAGQRILLDGDFDERTWVSGSGLLLRRECIRQSGFFDERFHSYVEDLDYCFRARHAGWRTGILTTAEGEQAGSVDSRKAVLNNNANLIVLDFKRHDYRAAARRIVRFSRYALSNIRQARFREAAFFARLLMLAFRRSSKLIYQRSERPRRH